MYSFESRVRYSEIDTEGRLSLTSMFNYLQDCSTFHSEVVGAGLGHMRSIHCAWLISAWMVFIDELPVFDTPIVTSTWSYEINRMFGLRNFTIKGADGTSYVRADSRWFLMGFDKGRPIQVPREEAEPYVVEGEQRLEMPPLPRKLAVEGVGVMGAPITVTDQHIDTNGHVNNAQYLSMVQRVLGDGLSHSRIDVHYKKSAVLGDTIIPYVHDGDACKTVNLCDGDGATYALIRLTHPA